MRTSTAICGEYDVRINALWTKIDNVGRYKLPHQKNNISTGESGLSPDRQQIRRTSKQQADHPKSGVNSDQRDTLPDNIVRLMSFMKSHNTSNETTSVQHRGSRMLVGNTLPRRYQCLERVVLHAIPNRTRLKNKLRLRRFVYKAR